MSSGAALRRSVEPVLPGSGSIPANDIPLPSQVLELANCELTSFQKWTGRGLDEGRRLGRLLLFRNLALEAELLSRWNRADFFWQESHRQLRELVQRPGAWIAGTEVIPPDRLKQMVVEEFFVKTHLGLNHTAAKRSPEKPAPGSREFAHVRNLRDVFDIAGTESTRQAELLVSPADRWIKAESDAKNWKSAITIVRDMIARVPQERKYPEQLMVLEFQSTRDSLTSGPLKPRDATKLRDGIERLEQLRKQYPALPIAFALIGRLRHLRAIALGNNNELSEALVESQKGMDYAPGDEDAAKTDERLVENMKALRARMEAVLQQIRTGYNKRLTSDGQRLANEASSGFTPVNTYIKSTERTQLLQEMTAARHKDTWLDVGYAEPPADWDARATRLYSALSEVLEKSPSMPTTLGHMVRTQFAGDELLAGLDPVPSIKFLAGRLFPDHQPKPEPPPPQDLPEYELKSAKRVRGDEPFLFWLFSRQGIRLKIQASLALALLCCALTVAGFDSYRGSRQDRAYAALMNASAQNDFSHVIGASEDFLTHPALHYDNRTPQVKGLYSEALVRWFLLAPGKPDEAALQRVRRYQQLTSQVE